MKSSRSGKLRTRGGDTTMSLLYSSYCKGLQRRVNWRISSRMLLRRRKPRLKKKQKKTRMLK
jgi:hypothetical protein